MSGGQLGRRRRSPPPGSATAPAARPSTSRGPLQPAPGTGGWPRRSRHRTGPPRAAKPARPRRARAAPRIPGRPPRRGPRPARPATRPDPGPAGSASSRLSIRQLPRSSRGRPRPLVSQSMRVTVSGPLCTAFPGQASPCTTPLGRPPRPRWTARAVPRSCAYSGLPVGRDQRLDRVEPRHHGRDGLLRIPGRTPRPARTAAPRPARTAAPQPAPALPPGPPTPRPPPRPHRRPRHLQRMQPAQRGPQHPQLCERRPDQRPLDERGSQGQPDPVGPDRIAGPGPDHPGRRVPLCFQPVQRAGLRQQPVQHRRHRGAADVRRPGASARQARTIQARAPSCRTR